MVIVPLWDTGLDIPWGNLIVCQMTIFTCDRSFKTMEIINHIIIFSTNYDPSIFWIHTPEASRNTYQVCHWFCYIFLLRSFKIWLYWFVVKTRALNEPASWLTSDVLLDLQKGCCCCCFLFIYLMFIFLFRFVSFMPWLYHLITAFFLMSRKVTVLTFSIWLFVITVPLSSFVIVRIKGGWYLCLLLDPIATLSLCIFLANKGISLIHRR